MSKNRGGMNEKLIKCFILVWFGVGMIQRFISHDFLTFLVANYRTSETRGVCSLASEPSFYGYMMCFFLIITTKFKTRKKLYGILCIIQIVFLAQSSVSIVYLMIIISTSLISYLIKENKIKAFGIIILAVIAVYGIYLFIIKYMSDTRMFIIIHNFVYNRQNLLNDVSIQRRVDSISNSFYYFVKNISVPYGFISTTGSSGRIMSGYGAFMVEMGFIAIPYMFFYSKRISQYYGLAIAISLTIIMFSAIQVGIAVFGFILGLCLYDFEMKADDQYDKRLLEHKLA